MENNGEKKGFWSTLFSRKPAKCSCGDDVKIAADGKGLKYGNASNGNEITVNPGEIKEIKILGPGCSKCKSTFAVVDKVIKASGADVKLTKVDNIEEIMSYNIMTTPAIVVDGKVVMKGKVPSEAEIHRILGL